MLSGDTIKTSHKNRAMDSITDKLGKKHMVVPQYEKNILLYQLPDQYQLVTLTPPSPHESQFIHEMVQNEIQTENHGGFPLFFQPSRRD